MPSRPQERDFVEFQGLVFSLRDCPGEGTLTVPVAICTLGFRRLQVQEGDERGDVASRPKATELRNLGKFQGLASARPRDCPGESTSAFGISGARKGAETCRLAQRLHGE